MNFYVFNNGIISRRGMSGSDRRALEWIKIFLGKGHEIYLFIPEAGRQRYEGMGPHLHIMVTSKIDARKFGFFPTYLWRALKACLLQPRPEPEAIIYSSSDLLADSLPAVYMKLRNRGARWIAGLHLLAPHPFKGFQGKRKGLVCPALSNIYYFLSQRLVILFMRELAFLVLVSNKPDREFLLKKGFSPERVLVTYGGIDLAEAARAKGKPKYDACFVGRFHVQKGLLDLIEVWERVCRQRQGARLAVIGEGEGQRELKATVRGKGLQENIEFLGFLDGREKFEVLKSSRIFLFPSTYESFGMVACEAMACGLPVVAYDLPIFKEIYPRGMVRVPLRNIEKFSQEVTGLLHDEKRRKSVSGEALKMAAEFKWERTAEVILGRLKKGNCSDILIPPFSKGG